MSGKRADLYKLIDANRDGTIGLDELARYINTFGPALTKPEVDLMMKMIGMENKQSLSNMDFDDFMDRKVFLTIPKNEVLPHFEVFDPANTGKVSFNFR